MRMGTSRKIVQHCPAFLLRTDLLRWGRFRGFLQLYQLQTSSDEEESYNDLVPFVSELPGLQITNSCISKNMDLPEI